MISISLDFEAIYMMATIILAVCAILDHFSRR